MVPRLCIGFWLAALALAYPIPATAVGSAFIAEPRAYAENPDLKLSLKIENCFTEKMLDAIKSGVVTTFKILIVLDEPGLRPFRTRLLDTHLEHSLKYDQLTDEYHVTLSEHPQAVFTTSDFNEAKRLMSELDSVPILPLWRLEPDQTYKLRIKAELSKVRLPTPLRYLFFFVSLWDFETAWVDLDFPY